MTYLVTMERDATGWWVASVDGLSGCRTQGRSIRQARARIREAIAVCTDAADVAESQLDVRVALPQRAEQAVESHARANAILAREQTAARKASDAAVRELVSRQHLSVRDAAELLGLSHQRIHQLLNRS